MTRKQIPLRLPEALVERLDAWAEAEKLSRNAAIERALDLTLPGGEPVVVRYGNPRLLAVPGEHPPPADWQRAPRTGPRNWDGSPVERKPYQKGAKK
jgi:hypothetical protein